MNTEERKMNATVSKGPFAVYKNEKYGVTDKCSTGQLVYAECPPPQSGRKGPKTIKEAMGSFGVRVTDGISSDQGSWPWMVSIIRDGYLICGASLLTSRWIISAAHCFDNFESFHYEVSLGMLRTSSFSPLTQTRPVANIFVHPKFDLAIVNDDIALLSVQVPFELNQWTAPISLPPANYIPKMGTRCTISGWGAIFENNGTGIF